MQHSTKSIMIGAGMGLAFFMTTSFLVYAWSGFAFNMGQYYILLCNGFGALVQWVLLEGLARYGLRGTALFGGDFILISPVVAGVNMLLGAFFGWLLRHRSVAVVMLYSFLAQCCAAGVTFFLWWYPYLSTHIL